MTLSSGFWCLNCLEVFIASGSRPTGEGREMGGAATAVPLGGAGADGAGKGGDGGGRGLGDGTGSPGGLGLPGPDGSILTL
jgi:hypothetical protein